MKNKLRERMRKIKERRKKSTKAQRKRESYREGENKEIEKCTR